MVALHVMGMSTKERDENGTNLGAKIVQLDKA